jgi:hypothetical protein
MIRFKLLTTTAMVILWATDSKDLFQVGDCDSHGDLVGHNDLAHTTWYTVKKKLFNMPFPSREGHFPNSSYSREDFIYCMTALFPPRESSVSDIPA